MAVCKCFQTVRSSLPTSLPLTAAKRSSQALNCWCRRSVSALSGRNAGYTRVPCSDAAICLCHPRSSVGIVSSAYGTHLKLAEDAAGTQLFGLKDCVRIVPNLACAARIQRFIDSEVTLQFQMRPVIERIAQRLRNRCGPRQKLFKGIGVSGTVTSPATPLARMARHL